MRTTDGITVGVIDEDDVEISNGFNVDITKGELDGNIDGREDGSKDGEDEGNVVSKVDGTKDGT